MSAVNGETLFLLGSSHHTAPLEIREQIALTTRAKETLYETLLQAPVFNECLILNTCNRVEIYGVSADPNVKETVQSLLYKKQQLNGKALDAYTFWKTNEAVIQHIFQVAAGLDSQMVGETEIFGQVKDTFSEAREKKVLGPILNRVFQKSFQAAKWARTHTGIGRGQVSVGNVATDLAMRICGDLQASSILTIGSGEVGEKATQALISRGAHNITVANRNLEKAHRLADQFKGAAMRLSDVPFSLQNFDIVIGCTASPDPVLTLADVECAMQTRATRPLFMIDLAVPRDVEQTVSQVSNVYLYNIDHLAKIANENLKNRIAEMESCRRALFEKAEHVWNTLQTHREKSDSSHQSRKIAFTKKDREAGDNPFPSTAN